MTRSNVRSVRRRQTNQRIQRQYDKEKQSRVHQYQQRSFEARQNATIAGDAWKGWYRKTIRYLANMFSGLFGRSAFRSIRKLDLRASDASRFGAFRFNRARDTGAAWLRNNVAGGYNLKMISTRDGKPV